uniref:GRAM domain containing 1Bb n=1 Tax=Cyprinus carpio TaxID=7962 RepID=A0A8C1UWD0_CYPCA
MSGVPGTLNTASNSNRSSPACSPVLRKRCRSPILQNVETDTMVEKGSEQSDTSKSPSTPEQLVTRTFSGQSTRSGGKNSKVCPPPHHKYTNLNDYLKLFKYVLENYSCALQRDILLQGRLYLSENWICFYSNIFRWETLLTVRLKDICSMTKEKTARLIPNAIQVCTDTEKHFFTSFGARDRTYMMMFRLWQNALLDKPLCPKELWHFVHQCYGNELGLTSDDEDYVPPDDDFNTMGYCEEIPAEENEVSNDNSSKSSSENKPDNSSPPSHKRSITHSTITSTTPPSSTDTPLEPASPLDPVPPLTLDFNDNEDIPTDLSDSSETDDEGDEVQAFHEDLNGRQYINEVYKFSVDKLYTILFTESQFMTDFMEQRRFTGQNTSETLIPFQESECYIIDAEVITHDVPYHDYFYTLNRYMLTRVAKNKCRLRVSTELRFRKQPWALVKGFIEKNFWSGLDENFKSLELELGKMEDAVMESHRLSPKAKAVKNSTLRRRKRPPTHLRTAHLDETLSPVTTPTDEEVIHRIKHVAGSTQTRHIPEHTPGGGIFCNLSKPLLIISIVLVLLVFLNVMLFYKLWMLEYSAQSLTSWQGLRLHESKLPQTQMEWAQLLESQQRYHDAELQKWREIIQSSVLLLDQMKDSLLSLQKGVGLRDYNSDSDEKRSRYY